MQKNLIKHESVAVGRDNKVFLVTSISAEPADVPSLPLALPTAFEYILMYMQLERILNC